MQFKDDRLLREAYSSVIKENTDNEFLAKNVEISVFNKSNNDLYIDDYGATAEVSYTIEIDYRSWGIKDIGVLIKKINPIRVVIQNLKTEEEQDFLIDPMQGEIEIDGSVVDSYGQVCPTSIEIHLDDNFKPEKTLVSF